MPNHLNDLSGAVVVITGASSGFGRGVALKLAGEGAKTVLAARRGAALEALASQIAADGGETVPVPADVSDPEDIARIAEAAIDRFGRIDVWINNAGIGALGLFWDVPIRDLARVVDVNLTGTIYGAHAALRQFRTQGFGTLINVGSIDSEVPVAYQSAYSATKAGVLSLSRGLNQELRLAGHDDIHVGVIMPWAVDTPWWTHAANYTGGTPRMAAMDDPELVVEAIVRACLNPQEEQTVGGKARASFVIHRLSPDLSERTTANIQHREVEKANGMAPTSGAIFEPMSGTTTIEGGIRERMKAEDEANRRSD